MQSRPSLLILVPRSHGDPNHLVDGSVPITSWQPSACPTKNPAILVETTQFLLRSAIGGVHYLRARGNKIAAHLPVQPLGLC
jgi:hypothetical protein